MSEDFQHPALYMPFEARINPHLGVTRERTKAWAHAIGFFDPQYTESTGGIWSEEAFDQADFAHFTALAYPDAPPHELSIVTDWHAWIWFVDDVFGSGYREIGDRAEALRRIARFMAFMPILPGPTPIPEDPAERAVADLWTRTAPAMSPQWRERFTMHVRDFLTGSLWETDNLTRDRFPDPIEQLEMRRRFGAAGFSAALLERAIGTEIPYHISRTRPFEVLIDTLRDAADLSNDIVSYAKDKREGVLVNNVIHTVRHLLDITLQQAVDTVNQLLTGRVKTLEETVRADLPQTMIDLDADELTSRLVLRYGDAMQTWLAGSYEWHDASGRFRQGQQRQPVHLLRGPTGIGTSAVHMATTDC
ncbi:hypothetical protein ACIA8G_04875 [Lentzea sp. NPDC051213]|uniref:terpene synthase family protein n=1 Tax=Lentzea sp. NPDC051213 TaxID=3364126 RepID=UPI0037B22B46